MVLSLRVNDLLEKLCSNFSGDLVRDCYGRVWSRGVRSTNRISAADIYCFIVLLLGG
jgi:hypothetical protein